MEIEQQSFIDFLTKTEFRCPECGQDIRNTEENHTCDGTFYFPNYFIVLWYLFKRWSEAENAKAK